MEPQLQLTAEVFGGDVAVELPCWNTPLPARSVRRTSGGSAGGDEDLRSLRVQRLRHGLDDLAPLLGVLEQLCGDYNVITVIALRKTPGRRVGDDLHAGSRFDVQTGEDRQRELRADGAVHVSTPDVQDPPGVVDVQPAQREHTGEPVIGFNMHEARLHHGYFGSSMMRRSVMFAEMPDVRNIRKAFTEEPGVKPV